MRRKHAGKASGKETALNSSEVREWGMLTVQQGGGASSKFPGDI